MTAGTPLSMSIAAGVRASTSEMRAPLHRSIRQKSRIFAGAFCAASTKRRRSGSFRYLRPPERINRLPSTWCWEWAPDHHDAAAHHHAAADDDDDAASFPPTETEWPILFRSRAVFAELQRICALPCRCHADFFILHGRFTDDQNLQNNLRLWRARRDFELLTPKFVVWPSNPLGHDSFDNHPDGQLNKRFEQLTDENSSGTHRSAG